MVAPSHGHQLPPGSSWRPAGHATGRAAPVHGAPISSPAGAIMTFKVGDHVTWNSEAGHVSGHIVRIHTSDVNYKGYIHHASAEDPQYEIQSDKTDHVAMHKGRALRKLGD
jgi:hypothetical protein